MGYRTVARPKFAMKASTVTRRVWRCLTIFRNSKNRHLYRFPKLNFSQKFPRVLFIESCSFWHRTCVLKNHEMIGREEITADERIFGRRRGLWSRRNKTFVLRKREVIEKVRVQLQRVKKIAGELRCPECPDALKSYTFQGLVLDCYHERGRVWMAKGELKRLF